MALNKNPKYDLKLKYKKVFEISIIVTLLLMIAAFKYFPDMKAQDVVFEAPQELVSMEDIQSTKQENRPPPPPKPPIPIEAPSDEVMDDIEIGDTELDINEEIAAPPPPPKKEEIRKIVEEEPVFFVAVEDQPEPVGGIAAIQRRIVYPEIARRAGVEGRVIVKAYVDETGTVVKTELLKGIGAGCDEATAAEVLKTKFKPGKQRGKPVKVQISLTFNFKLQ